MTRVDLPHPTLLWAIFVYLLTASALTPAANASRIAPNIQSIQQQYSPSETQGAEVLLRKSYITVDNKFLAVTQSYVAIAIHDAEAARDFSQIRIPYNDHYEDVVLDFAQVLTPQGQVESVADDALQIQSPSQEDFYQDSKVLTFSLPNVRPGAILEFQYTSTETKAIVPGFFFTRFNSHWWQPKAANQGGRMDPVKLREITIDTPLEMPLYTDLLGPQAFKASTKNLDGRKLWSWHASKIPALTLQSGMPSNIEWTPRLLVATSPSWNPVLEWSKTLFAPHQILDGALQKEIAKIKKQQLAPEARVRAIYRLLNKKVRYVFAHVGRGGYEPHSAPEVFRQGYGDCKDQTILAVTLLNALGVKAHPALIVTRDYGRPNLTLPGVYFNHMVTYIPAQEGISETWLDTTSESHLYPGGGFALEDQPALIIADSTQSVMYTQKAAPKSHWAKVTLDYQPPSGQEPFKVSMRAKLGGAYEQNIRSTWLYAAEKELAISNTFSSIFGNAEFTNLQVKHSDSLSKGIEITADWIFDDSWHESATKAAAFNITQLLNTFAGVSQWHKPQDREQPFEFSPGLFLEADINFLAGSDTLFPEKVTSGPNIKNQWFNLNQQSKENNHILTAKVTLEIPAHQLSVKEYGAFYDALYGLEKEPGFSIIYNTQRRISSDNLSPDLVRQLIADGKFEEALTKALRLVQQDELNGEFHYVLGLAQGYNNLLSESSGSFQTAEALGYEAP